MITRENVAKRFRRAARRIEYNGRTLESRYCCYALDNRYEYIEILRKIYLQENSDVRWFGTPYVTPDQQTNQGVEQNQLRRQLALLFAAEYINSEGL